LEGVVPSLLIDQPIKCQIVEKHIDTAAGKGGHGVLEPCVELREELPPSDDALVNRKTVWVIDHLWRQGPDQKVDAEKEPWTGHR
jgi:hypothetical protein